QSEKRDAELLRSSLEMAIAGIVAGKALGAIRNLWTDIWRPKSSSAIAGPTARDMPAVLWTAWTANLGATLFMDVDAIPLGTNFSKVLHEEVAKCGVLLAVIGPDWSDARDEHGNRRLDDPNDFVRIEIAAALQRNIPVIPVLLEGARIPKADELPEDLKELA